MEKGRSEQIIERLIDTVENGQSMPLSPGKVVINKDETILMLRELANIVNGELKVYREFNDRKGKIINDAKKEAEDIVYEAEQTASRIRVTKRMSSIGSDVRMERMDETDKMVLHTANDIYAASLIYTDEMLTEVNDVVAQAYEMINNQYGKMVEVLEEKAKIIADNKAELMASLKELSEDDRYSQILELGQLLSFELYNERMKARNLEIPAKPVRHIESEEEVAMAEDESDSAFEVTAEKTKDNDSAFVEPDKMGSESEEILNKTDDHVPEEKQEDSKDAVARTLNMFKNYKPGVRPADGVRRNER